MKKTTRIKAGKKAPELIKLDVGCGQNKQPGFVGIDLFEGADIVHDLLKAPWPVKDASVSEIYCSHVFEHIPGKQRPKFMDEIYRVLVPGGKATIIVPAYSSERAVQDFTHEWPPISPTSFYYFTKAFRDGNKLTHGLYDMKCDFDLVITGSIDPTWSQRELGVQQMASRNYVNVVLDFVAVMTKKTAS